MPAQVRMWNAIPYTVVDNGMLDGLKGAANRWFLPCVVFLTVFRRCVLNCKSNL